MLSPGQRIPTTLHFKVVHAGQTVEMALAELLTRRTVISVFMRNNTASCDRQKLELAAVAGEFDRAGYNLLGLSRDTAGSHARAAASAQLTFPLISDPQDVFAHAAKAMVTKSMYGRTFQGPQRSAWVVERDGTVLAVLPNVVAAHHADELRALIKTL